MSLNKNGEEVLEVRGGIEFIKKEFDNGTPQAGFHFIVPQASTLKAATDKYGEDAVLGLVNTYLANNARTKVKNSLTKFGEGKEAEEAKYYADKAASGNLCLFSIDEADKWIPGQREMTAKQWFEKAREAKKLRDEAKVKGDADAFVKYQELVLECMENASNAMEKE